MFYRDEVQCDSGNKLREQLNGISYDDLGNEVIDETKIVPKFIRQFFATKPKLRSKESHVAYWNVFNQFFNYLIENKIIDKNSLSDITEEDIQLLKITNINQYLIYCRDDKGNGEGTVNTKLNTLRSLFSYFVDDEIITRNITKNVSIDKPKQKPIKYATLEDRSLLISNLQHNMTNEYDRIRNIAIVHLLMGSGVRIQELVGLDMEHLHLGDETPTIFVSRKGGDTDNVPITQDARMALEEYLAIRDERVNDDNKHVVFISERRTRLSDDGIRKFLGIYSNGKITPHMFRKGLAMLIINSPEGSLKMVSDQLGNSELTASRYYAKTDVKIRESVMNTF